jgi:two-component system OmpR family sensor kinase
VRRSLQRELSRALGIGIVVAGIVAAAVSFAFAYRQAQELQDETLREIAMLAAGHASASHAGPFELADPSLAGRDSDSRVLLLSLSSTARPAWLPADLAPGFHTLAGESERMRVFVHAAGHERIAVAQSTDLRDESAINSALLTLLPLLVLVPLLLALVSHIVKREIAPLRRLSAVLDAQPAEEPRPLPENDVPEEAASFVAAINRLLGRVNKLIGHQRRFIADAAHELRSPLTALSVQARNLEQAASLEKVRERIAPLKAGIERARHLTEQLLDLAKTEAGGGEGTQSGGEIDVTLLARDLIAQRLPEAEQRGLDLGLELGLEKRAPATLRGNDAALRLILKNALENALRYTPRGGEVTVRIAADGEDLLIEVLDTGPGIPEAERERIFAPFYRIAGSEGEGSGLGLAIARDAATRLGGRISLHGRTDRTGTIFRYRQKSKGSPGS